MTCAAVGGTRNMVQRKPAISSITMHGASFSWNIRSASPDTRYARQVNATADSRYRGQEKNENIRYNGMATTVPAVPGAKGAWPLPKPVAATATNRSFRGHLFLAV